MSAGAPLEILYEDGPVIAVNKPAGLLTQGAREGIATLESLVKAYLKAKYNKPGNVYLGIPHRIDRPASGVVVFARNSKAAGRLAEQFQIRQVRKLYLAVTERTPDPPQATLNDWLVKIADEARVEVVGPDAAGAKQATLTYRVLAGAERGALVEIELLTGRTHQIRVQLASRGWPLVGDSQYGARTGMLPEPAADSRAEPIALHAHRLTFLHPVRYEPVTVTAPVPQAWAALGFAAEMTPLA
jgi:23S rRNA pseudouridine1911/1915/1917 synthase